MMNDFEKYWDLSVVGSPMDVGDNFRVRFHVLPGGKRYPEVENEYRTIFRRHKTLLAALKPKQPLYVVIPEWSDQEELPKEVSKFNKSAKHWKTYVEQDYDGSFRYTFLYVQELNTDDPRLDKLLRAVADDELGGVSFVSSDYKWVYHPYDGGCDIVSKSQEIIDELSEEYKAWLPESDDTPYSIALPEGVDTHNIPALIRHALKQVEEDKEAVTLQISDFYLDHPYSDDDKPSLNVDYRVDGIDAPQIQTKSADPVFTELMNVQAMSVRFPAGPHQADDIMLLHAVADKIEELGDIKVLEILYHDHIDDGGDAWPYVNVYFTKNK